MFLFITFVYITYAYVRHKYPMYLSHPSPLRDELLLLVSRKVVPSNETAATLYPAGDVQKMFTILNLPVPDFILKAAQGEVRMYVCTCTYIRTYTIVLCENSL